MEVLSEHLCQGWLEGYLLTGRHGLFNCYEAFIHIVDSMFNQHAKWLKVSDGIPWRRPIASLNYLLTSHVWRQDHNGFSHQDPGFIDHVVNKKAEVVRVYLPPDANCLLSVADHCLRSRDYVNVIVAGKQPALDYLTMDEAVVHCTRGHRHLGLGRATTRAPSPTWCWPARATCRRSRRWPRRPSCASDLPELKVRVVNVVDLMRLQPEREHPHGLSDGEFDALFTTDRPVIFAYHGYPWLIHRLTYRRANHDNIHVRGYKEEGTTTTPFDMVMLNDLDRFHLVMDVIDRVPGLGERAAHLRQHMADERLRPAPTPASTATIRPRSATGPGPCGRAGPTFRGAACASWSSTPARAASSCACSTATTRSLAAQRARRPAGAHRSERRWHGRSAVELGRRRRRRPPHRPRRRRVHARPVGSTPTSRRRSRQLTDLAPLHQPKSLAALDAVSGPLPDVPAVACFDTAFHATIPAAAATYALPGEWRERWDLRRFGFHGLSHAYVARRVPELLGRPADGSCGSSAATSGAGASLCAISSGALGRHHDGLHAAGGPGHGDPLRAASTRD